MKCWILLSGKNEKNIINLLSADYAQRVVKVKQLYIHHLSPLSLIYSGHYSVGGHAFNYPLILRLWY